MAKNLKKYINEFIDHVNKLESEEDPEGNGFNLEYRQIQEYQIRKRRENSCSQECGRVTNNLKKNRYKDILPYDDHRVVLTSIEGEEDSDYINASKLMGVRGTGGYIASQGPLASTVNDFWRMAWENDTQVIFMACRIVEMGKIKCKQYWNDVGKSMDFGDISVFTESEDEISEDYIKRLFKVTRGQEERNVVQFHYSGWPDHGIPRDPDHIINMIGEMRAARTDDQARLLVHCSAGCGRTGAIIAIDFVWTLLEEGRLNETFSLYELICNFRDQRMSIVQTAEQYALVNQVLRSLCQQWVDKMANHTYENVMIQATGEVSMKTESPETGEEEYCNVTLPEENAPPPPKPSRPENSLPPSSSTSPPSPSSTNTGPEVIEVIPPSQRGKKNSAPTKPTATATTDTKTQSATYENTVIRSDSQKDSPPPCNAPLPPSPAPISSEYSLATSASNQTQSSTKKTTTTTDPAKSSQQDTATPPVHSTIIKVSSGSTAASKKPSGSDGSKDTKDKATAGANVIYMIGSQRTTSPATPATLTKVTTSAKVVTPTEAVYSKAAHPDGPISSQTNTEVKAVTVPIQPPAPSAGFGERLPRVNGPRPPPQSWT